MPSGPFFQDLLSALRRRYESGEWRAMLVDGYEPQQQAHWLLSEAAAFEVAPAGSYVAGGLAVPRPVLVFDEAAGDIVVTFSAAVWPRITMRATGLIHYQLGVEEEGEPDRMAYFRDLDGAMRSSAAGDFMVGASRYRLNFPDAPA